MIDLLAWFGAPTRLWLLLPVLALVVADALRAWGTASVGRRIAGATVRGIIMASLVVALADPRWHRRDPVAHVVMVVDRSASISDAALQAAMQRVEALRSTLEPNVEVGLVLFDATPRVVVFPGDPWTVPDPPRETMVEVTDIDAALRLASGLVPTDGGGEVVLLSDARPTVFANASTLAADPVDALRARGVALHTIGLSPARDDPAITSVVLADGTVRPGATLEGHVELDGGSTATRGTLTLRMGTEVIAERAVEIEAGHALDVPFSHDIDVRAEAGSLVITAELTPHRDDPDASNNHATATAVVGAPPRVRIFAGETHDAESLARALRAERMDVQVVDVRELEPEHEDLSAVDLVVLANAPAAAIAGGRALQPGFVEQLGHFVDRGGGLLVLGGPQAFDMGGYGHSALHRVLPVKIDPVDPEVQAGATMIIILDRSGSMSATVGFSKTKMQLADEGAAASIRLLRPFDNVGVMSVTEVVRWDVPIQEVSDPSALERKVMGIVADGGGIFVYTSLAAAKQAMETVDSPLKHVILFSDAADSEEKIDGIPFGGGPGTTAQDLAKRMRLQGITISVIGIGTHDDVDTPFLEDLARAGGGRFYLTADATKLRSLFVEETERLVDSSVQEGAFRPVAMRKHPMVAGINYSAGPELRGYQQLEARTTAEVVLTGPHGDPLLTTWRYGLGQVVAWSSDAGPRWSESWLGWDGYARQWTQIARFALRARVGDETAIEVDHAAGATRVRIARRDTKGSTIDEGGVTARVLTAGGSSPLALSSPEPGLWEGSVASPEPGTPHVVEVLGPGDAVLATQMFAPPPSEERRHRTVDEVWLRAAAERAEGFYEPQHLDPKTVTSVTTDVLRLWPFALLLALFALPFDALLRRPARVM